MDKPTTGEGLMAVAEAIDGLTQAVFRLSDIAYAIKRREYNNDPQETTLVEAVMQLAESRNK